MPELPSILCVISQDFGELSYALDFVTGTPLQPRFLLPQRLLRANRTALPAYPFNSFASAADIRAVARTMPPAILLLCSGYLLGLHGLVAPDALLQLVQTLRKLGWHILTTDPFLGLCSDPHSFPFSDALPNKSELITHFTALRPALADAIHLYPVPPDGIAVPHKFAAFNPHTLIPPAPPANHWLFILSQEDYARQCSRLGKPQTDALIAARLNSAATAGTKAIAIAPPPCAQSVTPLLTHGDCFLPFCAHATFRNLLLTASQVFYWNIFSNSILSRVVNRLPLFFLDEGHMAAAFPPILEIGRRLYYANLPLPMISDDTPLTHATLAAAQRPLDAAVARILSLPTPVAALSTLLSE